MTPSLRAAMGETEESVQRAIIDTLRYKGYDVRQTTVRLRRCPKCGAPPAGNYGSDKGIADLLVWVSGAWRMMEVKGPKTRISPEQREGERDGKIVIVRSIDEALTAVKEWENRKL